LLFCSWLAVVDFWPKYQGWRGYQPGASGQAMLIISLVGVPLSMELSTPAKNKRNMEEVTALFTL